MAEEEIKEVTPQEPSERRTGAKAIQLVDYAFWLLEGFIIIRFIFKLIGADPENGFVKFVYNITSPFVVIFKGIVADITTGSKTVFEISSLIALVILWLLYLAVIKLIHIYTS